MFETTGERVAQPFSLLEQIGVLWASQALNQAPIVRHSRRQRGVLRSR